MHEDRVLEPATAPDQMEGFTDRLRARDPQALGLLFDFYFDRVFGYVRKLVADEHLAEDVTQEIFMKIQRSLDTYDPERALEPWLFTIVTNKIRDHWRSRRHRDREAEVSVSGEEGDWDAGADTELPEYRLEREEAADELRSAVERLPAGLRKTVLLRVYEGLTFERVGELLDRSEIAARKRYSRALHALRGILADREALTRSA